MPFNLSLPNLILSLALLLLFSCGSERHNPLGLANQEISYVLLSGSERLYKASCTLTQEKKNYKLSIKGTEKSEGIIFTVKNIKALKPQVLRFNREVSVIVNEKPDKDLNIYVSSGCKENSGTLEIVDWDKRNKTITGTFAGPICTRGIFAHLPSTEIKEGAFYKVKYNVK